MNSIERIVERLHHIVSIADRPNRELLPSKSDMTFEIFTIPYEGFNLVFRDNRLPRIQQYQIVDLQRKISDINTDLPMPLKFDLKVHVNPPVHVWCEIIRHQFEVPTKFRASDWEYSGGGLFSRPNKVITEWTEHKGYIERKIDYDETYANLLKAFREMSPAIAMRIKTNDKFLQLKA